ncbi:insulinase family protein [Candidatus Gottesmanbacteria bacterium]|nr:insulinase family protein [Candidatus Gottesmanbacteria bacterium]
MGNAKPYEKHVLSSGVRLILVPMEGVNSVATSVMVAVGSRYETTQINGISHFLEHMVFKGTKKYPTTDDVNIIERAGGLQNAYTDIDVTSFHNKVLSTDWELALNVNRELALAPLLLQKHVERERNVIIEEMKRYEDEPAAKVEEAFHHLLYQGTTLGMRIIGEEKSLRSVASAELKRYHDQWYQPERMVVVLAGNLNPTNTINTTNPTNKIREKAEQWFGGRALSSSGPTPSRGQALTRGSSVEQKLDSGSGAGKTSHNDGFEIVKDNQDKPQLAVVTKPDAQQAHMILGLRTFARTSRERYAGSLFNLIMGVSFTSRLFREIREKRGLCYHIRSSQSSYADVGNWSIYAGVATDKVEEATQAILAELVKAAEKGVTEEEVAVAKKRLKTIIAFKSEDPEFLGEYFGRQEVYREPIETLDDYIKQIDKVTKEQINKLAKTYLVQRTLNMAVVWNRGRDATLEKLLTLPFD